MELFVPRAGATKPPPAVQQFIEVKPFEQPELPKPESWEQDIAELENYIAGITQPPLPVIPNDYSTITDYSLFIESHFATVKTNNGKLTFFPYLKRLEQLKECLNNIIFISP